MHLIYWLILRYNRQMCGVLMVFKPKLQFSMKTSFYWSIPRYCQHAWCWCMHIPGEHKKSSPLRLLLIFQLWVQIFAWNFTRLSNNQIHTLSPSLVKIYRKMTKLCCFSQDNPPFSVCKHHAKLNECEWVHWEDWVALKLSRFEPTGLSHLGHHAGKVL